MQLLVEALTQAIEASVLKEGAIDTVAIGVQLAKASVILSGQKGSMRALDHQFQQPLVVGVMDKLGAPGVKFDVEGSGYGFRVIKTIDAARAEMPSTCKMLRT
jgi:branched-chain amino acid transport system substrate-binding protein